MATSELPLCNFPCVGETDDGISIGETAVVVAVPPDAGEGVHVPLLGILVSELCCVPTMLGSTEDRRLISILFSLLLH